MLPLQHYNECCAEQVTARQPNCHRISNQIDVGPLPSSPWWHLSMKAPGNTACACSKRDRWTWCRQLNACHAACAGFFGGSHIAAPGGPSSSQETLPPPGQQRFERGLHLLDPGRVMSPARERHRKMPIPDPLDAGSPKLMLPLPRSAPVLQSMGTCLFRVARAFRNML